ncbi:MAG: 50S ribosomal protein L9 [Kiritimatiellaeota bacterium]|nr:50S ribosomal protein L9 [Kiritimatiellota bacterium]
MAKEVILMADVAGLGKEGDVVRVAEGHLRNYLAPNKLAAPVTAATRRQLEKKRQGREQQLLQEREQAVALGKRIEEASCTIPVKAGADSKLFGSVTVTDLLAALKAQGLELAKHQLLLPEPLRELGVFQVPVKLHPDLQVSLKVWVVEE